MDDNTLSALRTQLVRLIINQGTIFSNWIKFAITVQGALAAGLGFALSDAKYRVFGLIMALLGIGTALGFAAILVRQAQWLMWFAQRWNSLATTSEIFPTRPGEIVRLNPGRVAMLVGGCLLLVAIAWIVIFVVVLLNAAPEGAVECVESLAIKSGLGGEVGGSRGAPNEGGLAAPHGYNYPTSAATSISQATLHTVMARRPHFE
jgi:hypothetical protein